MNVSTRVSFPTESLHDIEFARSCTNLRIVSSAIGKKGIN